MNLLVFTMTVCTCLGLGIMLMAGLFVLAAAADCLFGYALRTARLYGQFAYWVARGRDRLRHLESYYTADPRVVCSRNDSRCSFTRAMTVLPDPDDTACVTLVRSGWGDRVTAIYEDGSAEDWDARFLRREEAEKRYDIDLSPLFDGRRADARGTEAESKELVLTIHEQDRE